MNAVTRAVGDDHAEPVLTRATKHEGFMLIFIFRENFKRSPDQPLLLLLLLFSEQNLVFFHFRKQIFNVVIILVQCLFIL